MRWLHRKIDEIKAIHRRTLPCIDFDRGGIEEPGMSWVRSIYLYFYYIVRRHL